jgi:hypothetical protein
MPHDQVVQFVTQAEADMKKSQAAASGGFPWWILLVGGVGAKVTGII